MDQTPIAINFKYRCCKINLFVRQRTTLINAIRFHMAEFGIFAGIGRNGVNKLLTLITKGEDGRILEAAHAYLMAFAAQFELVKRQIIEADREVSPGR